jgi:hypothetical protein
MKHEIKLGQTVFCENKQLGRIQGFLSVEGAIAKALNGLKGIQWGEFQIAETRETYVCSFRANCSESRIEVEYKADGPMEDRHLMKRMFRSYTIDLTENNVEQINKTEK